MIYKFRDYSGDENELTTFFACEEPAFLVDLDMNIRLSYGDRSDLEKLLVNYSVLGNISILDIPKDQEEIDKLFQSTGYLSEYIERLKEEKGYTTL